VITAIQSRVELCRVANHMKSKDVRFGLNYSDSHFELQRQPDRPVELELISSSIGWSQDDHAEGGSMLYWALVFLIVAIIAAIFGFGGVAVAAAGIAKLLFFVFLVVFVITLITGLTRRGRTGI